MKHYYKEYWGGTVRERYLSVGRLAFWWRDTFCFQFKTANQNGWIAVKIGRWWIGRKKRSYHEANPHARRQTDWWRA